jgi:carboxymethylenebutenolidase
MEINMGDVKIHTDGGALRAFLSEPEGTNLAPGVIVLHEILGLNDDIRGYCRRFSAEGYLALAPDLFSSGARWRCLLSTFRALGQGDGQAFRDIQASRDFLADLPRCTGAVGIIGFCMGGGFALLMAPSGGFAVTASSYGRVPDDPHSLLAGACPVVGSYGARDWTERGHAGRLERALTDLGVPHDVREYPEASHSFMNEHHGAWRLFGRITGFGYHGPSAEDAWQRVLAAFGKYLREE